MRTTISSSDYVTCNTRPWRDIFQDLEQAGCYQNLLAELIQRRQSTVYYWIHNCEDLPDSAARAILALHMRYCGHEKTNERLNQSKDME